MALKSDQVSTDCELYTFSSPDETTGLDRYAPAPMSKEPGLEGYLVPYYVLSDRGTFFVPGSFKKTAKERLKKAPHLFQHWTDNVLGVHTAADAQDTYGFRIAVAINEETSLGAEVMSNHRFAQERGAQAYQFSVGVDRIAWRSGEEKDEAKLDRSHAPDYFKTIPINELIAYTEAKWWESSTVTFAGIGNAQPDIIHSKGPALVAGMIEALKTGSVEDSLGREIKALVAAYQAAGGEEPSDPGTPPTAAATAPSRRAEVMDALSRYSGLVVKGYAAS